MEILSSNNLQKKNQYYEMSQQKTENLIKETYYKEKIKKNLQKNPQEDKDKVKKKSQQKIIKVSKKKT